jgi:DNA-binding MarR family transcriptional regulator
MRRGGAAAIPLAAGCNHDLLAFASKAPHNPVMSRLARPNRPARAVAAEAEYDLKDTLPYLLNRAGMHIGAAFSGELRSFRITLPMWRVLAALLRQDGQTLSQLADQTSVELSTLSRQVQTMQRRGLVARAANGRDGRALTLLLTPDGRALARAIAPLARHYERVALSGLDARDVRRLKDMLKRVYRNIRSLGGEARPAR